MLKNAPIEPYHTKMFDGSSKLAIANYVIPTAKSFEPRTLDATARATIGTCLAAHTVGHLNLFSGLGTSV